MRITFINLGLLKKTGFYIAYWTAYLAVFSLVEGLPAHDLLNAFAGELVSLPLKVLFVLIVVEKLTDTLFLPQRFKRFFAWYVLLLVFFAFVLRLVDNDIILKYLLVRWKPETLLSAAPFLYNAIKLQFLVTIPFGVRLYHYRTEDKLRAEEPQINLATGAAHADFIQVRCDRRMLKIRFTEICYIEAQGNYLYIYTLAGAHRTYLAFSELEEQLPRSLFVRVHRSFIVSLAQVKSFSNAYLNVGDKQLPIGRSYQSKVKSALTQAVLHQRIGDSPVDGFSG